LPGRLGDFLQTQSNPENQSVENQPAHNWLVYLKEVFGIDYLVLPESASATANRAQKTLHLQQKEVRVSELTEPSAALSESAPLVTATSYEEKTNTQNTKRAICAVILGAPLPSNALAFELYNKILGAIGLTDEDVLSGSDKQLSDFLSKSDEKFLGISFGVRNSRAFQQSLIESSHTPGLNAKLTSQLSWTVTEAIEDLLINPDRKAQVWNDLKILKPKINQLKAAKREKVLSSQKESKDDEI